MTDLEMTKLCAQAMDFPETRHPLNIPITPPAIYIEGGFFYSPLRDDAQAMALLRKFPMDVFADRGTPFWRVRIAADHNKGYAMADDINRAIVECVAMLQVDRTAQETAAMGKAE